MTSTWFRGQPVGGGPVIPTIMNCRFPDGELYRQRQEDRFIRGLFGYVPVTMVRADDQTFPDLGRGPMRTVVMAGQVWRGHTYIIEVEHDPAIESDHAKDETRHTTGERIFARRPTFDIDGIGLKRVELELPADMDSDGNRIDATQRGMPAYRIAALAAALLRTGRPARASSTPVAPEPVAEEIGLGSRRGDVDWLGRRREFSADADMGQWEPQTALAVPYGRASWPEVGHQSEQPRSIPTR